MMMVDLVKGQVSSGRERVYTVQEITMQAIVILDAEIV
jgi:hypothetical protein